MPSPPAAPPVLSGVRRAVAVLARTAGVLTGSLFAASLLIFLGLHVLPGDAAGILAGTDATPAQVAAIRAELGLDRPVLAQYAEWIVGALTGDLGVSSLDHRPVAGQLAEKLQVTLPLCLMALVLSTLIAVPVGMLAGVTHDRPLGAFLGAASQLGVAIPSFVAGMALVSTFSVRRGWFPAQGFPADRWASPGEALWALLLPSITLAIPLSSGLVRFVRSATIDLLGQDWVRTARAQGWSLGATLIRQGLRNASLPLIAVIGLELAGLLMGSVLVEQVFSLPGVGQMILQDVGNRDLVKVQGTLLVLTALVMGLTLGLNALSRLVDPRIGGAR